MEPARDTHVLAHAPALIAPVEVASPSIVAVSVILPVYNEASGSPAVVEQVASFSAAHLEYRFYFVDDGSADGTSGAIQAAIDRLRCGDRVHLVSYRANGGKGHAVARGIAEVFAHGGDENDPVIFTDGDLAYSLDHLAVLAEALRTCDVVIGSRRGPEGGYGAHPARHIMGWTYNRMARLCLGAPYRDTQAGLKGFRLGAARRIFAALRSTGFGFDVELLYLARRFGYRVQEVPARVSEFHKAKASRVNLLRDPRRMFVGLAALRINGMTGVYDRAASGRRPLAAVSFDAEEFDMPCEYGQALTPDRQMQVGAEGMRLTLDVLDEVPAKVTFFTTSAFAMKHPELFRRAIAAGHEIASHSRVHTGFIEDDLRISREQIEQITGQPCRGFRRPRFATTDPDAIARAGYTYDSSINPIWLPGRYNGWKYPRRAFLKNGLVRIPVSASPFIRWPLFWLSFKNAPQWSTRAAMRSVLGIDGYAALCYHPWELCDLQNFDLPGYVKRIDGGSYQSRMLRFLRWLSRRATFVGYTELEDRFRAKIWPFGDTIKELPPA